ncbi:MAG: HAD hydrolase-like protein [Lachnospiraceae bacterium]|nr:HAD hydrolase-like protein [Lachnospiraceae bacterium]
MKIAIGFDLHNTIMHSNEAWIEAMVACSNECFREYITQKVYDKYSRLKLTTELGADYNEVLKQYHARVNVDDNMKSLLYSLKKNYPLYLISASYALKVYKDLAVWEGEKLFDEILTKECFDKASSSDWQRFLDGRDIDILVYIGNDVDEDIIKSRRVISLISGSFLDELKGMDLLVKRGEKI